MIVSVILPTCKRPAMLRTMLDSLIETTRGYKIEIIALIDNDLKSATIAVERGCRLDYSDERRSVLHLWNRGLKLSYGDIIHPAMDDLLYHDNWLDYALASHDERLRGYGMVGMNDLAYDGNVQVATQWIFDRRYCKAEMGGVIAPPMYNYLSIDEEWTEKARILGRYYWDKRAIVEHRHSAHGKRDYDEHDKWKDENEFAKKDRAIFEERKSQGFPVTWERMI